MLATGSQLARRSLGILGQQLEHHVQLIEHVRIRHHWVLGFLKTRNSKLDTGHISPFIGLKTCSHRFSDYGVSACRIHGRSGPRPLRARRQADAFCRSEKHCLARLSVVTAGVVPRPGSFGRTSDLSSASGDRAVAADCPATTDALAGEKSSARWEKRGGWWQATLRHGTTRSKASNEMDF